MHLMYASLSVLTSSDAEEERGIVITIASVTSTFAMFRLRLLMGRCRRLR